MGSKSVALIAAILIISILTSTKVTAQGPFGIIKNLLQENVAGNPVIHQKSEYDFDPEVAKKRRQLFYETHGYRAEKFIERIGVGIDGQEDERRVEQSYRDQGRLNGEHFINFP
ncbi:unnamed protein product [Hermetia illucens]|uniref:Uncharacterized protein n=1 Tax=Hermetia illucens TaxID=343691 RepID=A0A7R8Z067_HERIL|nr:uncharacterized protein LOC119659546 [Hermetia illucens]CAD7092319.1 unnamed protein product [Hermetia illucens]